MRVIIASQHITILPAEEAFEIDDLPLLMVSCFCIENVLLYSFTKIKPTSLRNHEAFPISETLIPLSSLFPIIGGGSDSNENSINSGYYGIC